MRVLGSPSHAINKLIFKETAKCSLEGEPVFFHATTDRRSAAFCGKGQRIVRVASYTSVELRAIKHEAPSQGRICILAR